MKNQQTWFRPSKRKTKKKRTNTDLLQDLGILAGAQGAGDAVLLLVQRRLAVNGQQLFVGLAVAAAQHRLVDGAPQVGRNLLLAGQVQLEAPLGLGQYLLQHPNPLSLRFTSKRGRPRAARTLC